LNYRAHEFRLSSALRGQPVGLRPRPDADGQREVLYCHQVIARIDLKQAHVIR
jgi:hypothetical protein